jgi:hypothetical protein
MVYTTKFLDLVTGQRGVRTMRPSSFLVQATRIARQKNENSFVLVELPGFGGSGSGSDSGAIAWSDLQALQEISTWLRRTCVTPFMYLVGSSNLNFDSITDMKWVSD